MQEICVCSFVCVSVCGSIILQTGYCLKLWGLWTFNKAGKKESAIFEVIHNEQLFNRSVRVWSGVDNKCKTVCGKWSQ